MRSKDFSLVSDRSGYTVGDGPSVRGDALSNRIILALEIVKGTFIADSSFGSRLAEVKKVTDRGAVLYRRLAEEALRFLMVDGVVDMVAVSVKITRDSKFDVTVHCSGGLAGRGYSLSLFVPI